MIELAVAVFIGAFANSMVQRFINRRSEKRTQKTAMESAREKIARKIHPAHRPEPNDSGPVKTKRIKDIKADKRKPIEDKMKRMFGTVDRPEQEVAQDADV